MIIYQPRNGYCYNSDTYFLANFITVNLKQFKNIQGELLDIGSGSGILGLLLATKYDKLHLNCSEIQKEFIFLTQKNCEINKIKADIYSGSFLNKEFNKEFDIVVSNPPFYPSCVVQTQNENKKIARYNDNLPLKEFINKTSKVLKPKGKFFFCYDVKLLNDIITTLKQNSLNIEAIQFLHPKKEKEASLVMVYARKNSKTMMKIMPPLIMFEKNEFSNEVNKIYANFAVHSIKVELDSCK